MKDGDDGDLDSRRRKETEKPSSVNSQAPILNMPQHTPYMSLQLEEGEDFDEELITWQPSSNASAHFIQTEIHRVRSRACHVSLVGCLCLQKVDTKSYMCHTTNCIQYNNSIWPVHCVQTQINRFLHPNLGVGSAPLSHGSPTSIFHTCDFGAYLYSLHISSNIICVVLYIVMNMLVHTTIFLLQSFV